jgi:DNA polymerase-3 subunit delta'
MTRPFDSIVAQPTAVRVLRRALDTGRIASSYLFEGPSGVGKQKTALALATELVAPGPSATEARRRIGASSHPDVRVFPPRDDGNRNIQVDFLRSQILPIAQYAPFEAERAVLIFPEADVSFPPQHPESANALLKTLEEPRRGVHFVLLSERPDRLLPTIRSRCQNVRFTRLAPGVVHRILAEHAIPESERDAAVALADGRADRALALAADGKAAELLALALRIDATIASRKPGSLAEAAEELARRDDLPLVLETLGTFYRDVAVATLEPDNERLMFRHDAAAIRKRARELDPGRAAARVERIRDTIDGFEWNANAGSALDALLFELTAV